METQAPYLVTVSPTLAELRALKTRYLAEHMTTIHDCLTLVHTLGQCRDLPYPWGASYTMRQFSRRDVRLELYEHQAEYLTALKAYNRITTLNVFAGGYQVVGYCTDTAGSKQDNYIVPGKWIEIIQDDITRALSVVQSIQDRADEQERRKLAAQLLIGVEV